MKKKTHAYSKLATTQYQTQIQVIAANHVHEFQSPISYAHVMINFLTKTFPTSSTQQTTKDRIQISVHANSLLSIWKTVFPGYMLRRNDCCTDTSSIEREKK